jgi:hypothetical protein
MASPLQFYRSFGSLLAGRGIRHALTSGMACVEYGIQQTTKDTDWIIAPADFSRLVTLLCDLESGQEGAPWRISYRSLFGAPLTEEYLGRGWTSHLGVHDASDSPEHHLDFFGQPPRIPVAEALASARNGVASRLAVAQMKKTDRDKDWPSVEALSLQAAQTGDIRAVLHLRDPAALATAWAQVPREERPSLLGKRPLLGELEAPRHGLLRCLAIERALWEQTNRLRYRAFQREWKEFIRRWRTAEDPAWPRAGSFSDQHRRIVEAVQRHGLLPDPLGGDAGRRAIIADAGTVVREVFAASENLISDIRPPPDQLLP